MLHAELQDTGLQDTGLQNTGASGESNLVLFLGAGSIGAWAEQFYFAISCETEAHSQAAVGLV